MNDRLPTDDELDATIRAAFGTTNTPSRPPKAPFVIVRRAPSVKKERAPKVAKLPRRARADWWAITAAKRVGISIEDYDRQIAAGNLWCYRHHGWHPAEAFGRDRARGRGRAACCRDARNARSRQQYREARNAS